MSEKYIPQSEKIDQPNKSPENKEKELPEKLYRNVSWEEIFMLWRDKELPLGAFPGSEDSTAEANQIAHFWFAKPFQFLRDRTFFLEIEPTSLSEPQKIKESVMTFRVMDEFPDDLAYTDSIVRKTAPPKVKPGFEATMREFTISERIPQEKLNCFTSSKHFIKYRLDDLKKFQRKADFEYTPMNWGPELFEDGSFRGLLVQALKSEFGEDYRSLSIFKTETAPKEESSNFEMNLYRNKDKHWFIFDQDVSESEVEYTLIMRDFFLKALQKMIDFFTWCQDLPETRGAYSTGNGINPIRLKQASGDDLLSKKMNY